MTVKEESEKVGLKLNIQKTKIMAYGPMADRSGPMVHGRQMGKEQKQRFYFGGLQNHCQMVSSVMRLKDAHSLEEKL